MVGLSFPTFPATFPTSPAFLPLHPLTHLCFPFLFFSPLKSTYFGSNISAGTSQFDDVMSELGQTKKLLAIIRKGKLYMNGLKCFTFIVSVYFKLQSNW